MGQKLTDKELFQRAYSYSGMGAKYYDSEFGAICMARCDLAELARKWLRNSKTGETK